MIWRWNELGKPQLPVTNLILIIRRAVVVEESFLAVFGVLHAREALG